MTDQTEADPEGVDLSPPDDEALPAFEGVTPVDVKTALQGAGSALSNRVRRPLHLGERIILVVEATVDDVGHQMTGNGLHRHQKAQALDVYELTGPPGRRLLNTLRENWRLARPDSQLPIEQLDEEAAVTGVTDAAGVVMTQADLDELGLTNSDRDPVVLVLDDGTRAMWPDDWGKHAPDWRPTAGDEVWAPGDKAGDPEQTIVEVLSPVNGTVVATWTEEDRQARLLEEEQRAEAAEAAAEAHHGESEDLALTDGGEEE